MRLKALALVLLLGLAIAAPSGQQPEFTGAIEDEILVKFRPQADDTRRDAALNRVGGRRLKRFRDLDINHVRIPRGRRAADALAAIRADADVVAAQPNYIRRTTAPQPPNDFFWVNDVAWNFWGIPKIQAKQVWDTYTTGSSSVVVADIDSGVKYTHPDLAPNMWINPGEIPGNGVDDDVNGYVDDIHGIDTFNHDSNPMDDNGHGTHTAGTFGAVGNNGPAAATGTALVGVNWNVRILACKFLNAAGNGSDAGAIECFNYITALKNRGINIRVSNNSWGGYRNLSQPFPQLLKDAIDAAGNAGIINIFAAGNGGADGIGDNIDVMPHDPASFTSPSIVSVAASTSTDGRATFSNFGSTSVDLAAPGVDILSAWVGTDLGCVGGTQFQCAYRYSNGTSMAAPHVAGVAALLIAQFPELPVSGIKSLLIQSVTPVAAWTTRVASGGRLNAFTAATALNNNTPPTVSITSPLVGSEFTAPADVAITATASDSASVTSVEFFANGLPIGSDTTAPYSITAAALAAGSYNLQAKATDNLGAFAMSAPVPIVVNAPGPTPAEITQVVTSGGSRLQQLQNADGGWYFRATDTGCGTNAFAGGSCDNIIGVTGLGLLSAYQRNSDPAVLADAVDAGELLTSIHDAAPTRQPFSQDLEFLRALSAAGAGPQYAALASTWFTTVTYSHPVAADRVDWQFTHRQSLAVWDLASLIRSAKAADRVDYATALANRIVARELEWKVGFPYSLIGMGSLLWAIHDLPGFDAPITDYRSLLLLAQQPEGTWDGDLQTTAYVALGLGAVGGPGTTGAIHDAVAYFMANQLPNFGWPFAVVNGVPGNEYAMVDSEIIRAIDLLYSTGSGEGVTVTPAQLAAVTFETVSAAGMTTVVATAATSQARVPKRFTLVDGLTYEVTTTARVSGKTVMCVSVPWDALEGNFDRLRLLQPRRNLSAVARSAKVERFVDQTIMKGAFAPDAATKQLCAKLSSMAPVSVALLRGRR